MCDQYNSEFQVPAVVAPDDSSDWGPGGKYYEFLKPIPSACKTLHPVTKCQLDCAAIAKAKHEECKTKVKMFTEYMKANGCPGTWCSTKKKSPCARRKPAARKTAKGSAGSGCKTGCCGR